MGDYVALGFHYLFLSMSCEGIRGRIRERERTMCVHVLKFRDDEQFSSGIGICWDNPTVPREQLEQDYSQFLIFRRSRRLTGSISPFPK